MKQAFRISNRSSWLWLLLSFVLLSLTRFQTVIPVAAWLGTLLLLRFTRTCRSPVLAFLFAWLVQSLALSVGLRNNWIPAPAIVIGGFSVLFGLILAIAYGIDRGMSSHLRGILRSLVFPTAVVTIEWLHSLTPVGGWIPLGYTQTGNLSLMQIVSLTGIWGLSFLIAWFAAIVNDLWEFGFQEQSNRRVIGVFLLISMLVIFYGDARLAFATQSVPTVQIAGIVPDRTLSDQATKAGPLFGRNYLQAASRQALLQRFAPVLEDLFARTEMEARTGAKLIVWSEAAVAIPKENEAQLIDRAQTLARQSQIYLQLGFGSILKAESAPFYENRAVLIDPTGQVVWTYDKARPVFPGEYLKQRHGTGIIPIVQTPFGRVATIICYDADFPSYVQQAGHDRVDILLVPSNDGRQMRMTHHDNAIFRAVENGVLLIRPTSYGISSAIDPYGRALARTDHYANSRTVLRAEVPIQGVRSLYAIAGDYFAYLCAIALAILIRLSLINKKRLNLPENISLNAVTFRR